MMDINRYPIEKLDQGILLVQIDIKLIQAVYTTQINTWLNNNT